MISVNEIDQAKDLLRNKQYSLVLEKLILPKNGNSNEVLFLKAEGHLLRAEAYFNIGEYEKAQEELNPLSSLFTSLLRQRYHQEIVDKKLSDHLIMLIRINKALGKDHEYLAYLETALEEKDSHVRLFCYALKAEVEYENENYNGAINTVTTALELLVEILKEKKEIKTITTMQIEFDPQLIHQTLLTIRANAYLGVNPVKLKESISDRLKMNELEDLGWLKRLSQLHLLEISPRFFEVMPESRINNAVHMPLSDDEFLALHLQKSNEYLELQEYEKVIVITSIITDRLPKNLEARSLCAMAKFKSKDYQGTIAEVEKIRKLDFEERFQLYPFFAEKMKKSAKKQVKLAELLLLQSHAYQKIDKHDSAQRLIHTVYFLYHDLKIPCEVFLKKASFAVVEDDLNTALSATCWGLRHYPHNAELSALSEMIQERYTSLGREIKITRI
jgi:tetratricopeptide (TPR) repeat protein